MRLHFRSYGSGPPLLILHGLLGSLDNWATLARRFGEFFTVFTPDARNHGRSPHDGHIDYDAMAGDTREFMVQQGIARGSIIGHSMGGKTAMRCACAFPEMVDRLLVADILPEAYRPGHEKIFEALLAVRPDELRNRGEAEEAMKPFIPEFAVRQFLLKNLHRVPGGAFEWKMNLETIIANDDRLNEAVHPGARPFEKPTLFLRGGRSRYVPPLLPESVLAMFPAARLETVEEAGHWVHVDAPDEFFERVTAFLR